MHLDTAFTRLLGLRYPLQMASIGGMATPTLARAVSNAGGLGMLSGVVGATVIEAQLTQMPAGSPFGVGFLVPFLDEVALELAAARAKLVEFFWAEPDRELVERAKASGALCSWQVGSRAEAQAAQDAGCDVVVAQGVGAGGHVRGTTEWRALLDELRPPIDVPLVIGGGIGTAADVAAALDAGADGVRIGTRFMAATEAPTHPSYLDALIDASADDTVLTTAFGLGWPDAPHRVLRRSLEAGEAAGDQQRWTPDWPDADCADHPLRRALYAGTSVGAVTQRQSAAGIIAELFPN